MRKWLGLLMMVAFAVGALGGAMGGCAGLEPQDQLTLAESYVSAAEGLFGVWTEGKDPEDLAKFRSSWAIAKPLALAHLNIYLDGKGVDRARVEALEARIGDLDAAIAETESVPLDVSGFRPNPGVRCRECIDTGVRSRLYEGFSKTTLMAVRRYYNEDGQYVVDDPNTRTTHYSCSNGHSYEVTTPGGIWVIAEAEPSTTAN